ncbi:MAG: translocation/assembly module TamB domain-containing protein [Aromatoleum sp.]|uniref:translocation/assembly module TamB domain-containing protein n=1 Tax=Aromatoleum sp. TaxID=2307007 RepID=UPI0028955DBD|nr:translocation/assembly module TamB domain-containing protein [Aromatoleum sp.]MDT3670626.1 translocation/assembly module TamB domain-containing protein [Aromatoleum sp.]
MEPADIPLTKRRPWRIAGAVLLVVLLAVAVLALFAGWVVTTESGLRFAARTAERLTGGQVVFEAASGRLAGPLRIGMLRVDTADLRLRLQDLSLDWNPAALLDRHLDIARLSVGDVVVATRPTEAAPPSGPPQTLTLPVSLSLAALEVGHLAVVEWTAEPAPEPEPVPPVAPGVTFELSALTATIRSDGSRHRIDGLRVSLPFGQAELAGELDGGAQPFPLNAVGSLRGELTGHAYALNFRADGDLVAPHVVVDAEGAGLAGSADVLAAPFDPVPLRRLHAALGEIDPSAFNPAAPRAALRVEADLVPAADDAAALVGPITIENRQPDTVDRGGLPVERLAAQLRWTPAATRADALLIELPGAGTISGDAAWNAGGALGRLVANLQLARIDPARLDARLPTAVLAGTVEAAGDESAQTAKLDIGIGDARVRATGEMTATRNGDGIRRVVASGELERFDPHALVAAAPRASLNMSFEAHADLADPLRYDVAWNLRPSRLDGRPVSGRGRVEVEGQRLVDGDVDLIVAGNTGHLRGAWGRAGDSLDFRLDAPALAALGDEFGGSARAEGTISGSVERPAGTLTLFAESLRLPGGLRVAGLNAEGRLADGFDGDVRLALGLTGLGRGEEANLVDEATLAITGRGNAHTIDLVASGLEKDTVRLRLEGGLIGFRSPTATAGDRGGADRGARAGAETSASRRGTATRGRATQAAAASAVTSDSGGALANLAWEGRLLSLETSGRFPSRLTAPAELRAGRDRVALGAATIEAGERGRIRLHATEWTPESIVARGSLTGLALGLVRRADGSARRGPGPLVLGADWDLRLGETANGTARVFREAGDLRVEGEIAARLGLEHLEARLSVQDNRLALSWDARGVELGELVGSATALAEHDAAEGWRLAPNADLLGSARLTMPSIAWFGRLMQENIVTGGSLAADFALAGTAAAPRASGSIDGRELSLALVDQGLQLSGGELRAEFDRDALRLVRLEFVSPNRVRPRDNRVPVDRFTQEPGRLSAAGEIALDSGAGEFRYVADRLPILQRPDRWLILTGGGTARSTWTSLDLNAEFAANAGYVELAETPPPSLSSDVVVLGTEEPQKKGGFKLSADVAVALGDHLYLSALGVDTRLTGDLRLRTRDGEPLSAVGTISTVGGTFRGYGQNLAIERGRINFQGPLNNPGLNIVALRKGLAVEAGLAIVGSARRPQVRLVSEPNVPDPEKLSWLVLGRPPTAGSGADLGLLLPAAQALLGGPGGGMTDQMSRSLGFDQFSIGQGELTGVTRSPTSRVVGDGTVVTGQGTVSGQVLSLGKRLSSDLFLSFEQSLGGAENLVKLTYQLTRRVSVVARGGSDNSADIYYTISFR